MVTSNYIIINIIKIDLCHDFKLHFRVLVPGISFTSDMTVKDEAVSSKLAAIVGVRTSMLFHKWYT